MAEAAEARPASGMRGRATRGARGQAAPSDHAEGDDDGLAVEGEDEGAGWKAEIESITNGVLLPGPTAHTRAVWLPAC